MRFFAPLLFAVCVALSAPAQAHSYWIPMQWGMQEQSVPVKPLTAPRQVLIWNQFDEGHFDARLFEFEEVGQTGKFRRLPPRRAQMLGSFRTTNDEERCDQLLANSIMKRIDSTSFHDMGGIGYFPNEPGAFDKHIESAHELNQNQLVYLETTSWLSASELKETFGGKIPWGRIVEVEAPPGLSLDEVRAKVEAAPNDLRVRIRRSTLRLVAGQFLQWMPRGYYQARLPLESDRSSPPIAHARGQTPFVFELGRASQMKGLAGEAELLIPFALAIADHTRELFHPYPSTWEPMPPDTVGLYVLSLDRGHTTLFRRRLGMTVEREVEGHATLHGRLPDLIEKQKPSSRLESLAAIHAAVPGRYSELAALQVLRYYRRTFRRDFDLAGFTERSPIVVRDYSPGFEYNLREVFSPSWKPIAEEDFKGLMAALEKSGQQPSLKPHNQSLRDDVGERDWKKLGLAPVVISNFDEIYAAKSPDYLANVLLAFLMNWWPEKFPKAIADATTVVIATKSAEVARQADVLGFKKVDDEAYSLSLWDLAKLVKARPDLTPEAEKRGGLKPGFWMRYQQLSELYGL